MGWVHFTSLIPNGLSPFTKHRLKFFASPSLQPTALLGYRGFLLRNASAFCFYSQLFQAVFCHNSRQGDWHSIILRYSTCRCIDSKTPTNIPQFLINVANVNFFVHHLPFKSTWWCSGQRCDIGETRRTKIVHKTAAYVATLSISPFHRIAGLNIMIILSCGGRQLFPPWWTVVKSFLILSS